MELRAACDACGAEPGEDCFAHCIAVDSILNGIEDATNLADGGQTAGSASPS